MAIGCIQLCWLDMQKINFYWRTVCGSSGGLHSGYGPCKCLQLRWVWTVILKVLVLLKALLRSDPMFYSTGIASSCFSLSAFLTPTWVQSFSSEFLCIAVADSDVQHTHIMVMRGFDHLQRSVNTWIRYWMGCLVSACGRDRNGRKETQDKKCGLPTQEYVIDPLVVMEEKKTHQHTGKSQ